MYISLQGQEKIRLEVSSSGEGRKKGGNSLFSALLLVRPLTGWMMPIHNAGVGWGGGNNLQNPQIHWVKHWSSRNALADSKEWKWTLHSMCHLTVNICQHTQHQILFSGQVECWRREAERELRTGSSWWVYLPRYCWVHLLVSAIPSVHLSSTSITQARWWVFLFWKYSPSEQRSPAFTLDSPRISV